MLSIRFAVLTLAAVALSGCTTLIDGFYAMQAVAAGDMAEERAAEIDAIDAAIRDKIEVDDLEGLIPLTKKLWDISFAGSCNACHGKAWPALSAAKKAVLESTRPAYARAGLLKVASTEMYGLGLGVDNGETELEQFRAELVAQLKDVEEKAKPELIAMAEKHRAANHLASAALVYGQLAVLYPDDSAGPAGRANAIAALSAAHPYVVAVTGPVSDTVTRTALTGQSITFADAGTITMKIEVGEPDDQLRDTPTTTSTSYKNGMKSEANPAYKSIQSKIRSYENNIESKERSMRNSNNDWSSQIKSDREHLSKAQAELSRTSPTREVDNIVSASFPATSHSREITRSVHVTITDGDHVVVDERTGAKGFGSTMSHEGFGPAGLGPKHEAPPSSSEVDGRCLSHAASLAHGQLLKAYNAFIDGRVKGEGDAVEAAALRLVLSTPVESAALTEMKRALGVPDPNAALSR